MVDSLPDNTALSAVAVKIQYRRRQTEKPGLKRTGLGIGAFHPNREKDHHCAVYLANLCPISRGGAVSQTRLRTTILHNHAGHCKRSLRCLAAPRRDFARCGL